MSSSPRSIATVTPVELAVSAVAITSDTLLILRVVNTDVAIPLRVAGIVQDLEGRMQVFNQTFTVAQASVAQDFTLGFPNGRLLQVAVIPSVDFPSPGQVFAQVGLWFRQGTGSVLAGIICQGWISRMGPVTWPANGDAACTQSIAPTTSVLVTNPPAGSEMTFVTNQIKLSPCRSVAMTLVTSAAVATRQVYVSFVRQGGTEVRYYSTITQAASLTRTYVFSPSPLAAFLFNIFVQVPMPEYWSGVVTIVGFRCENIQAGDQLQDLSFVYTPEIATGF